MQVYILYSDSLEKCYVGHTNDLKRRMHEHNSGHSKFTRSGKPWKLRKTIECSTRQEAVQLEFKIKKRGIKRYLEDIKHSG
ncbi:MAG: GIY-YIG nuclease family protein [Bacteroidales bacterium]|nr:GIY-YIG nuclease family protein [Bacteroidales bacterium]